VKVSLDDFEMMKLLGYGTYGRVFLARKKDNGKIYAIKVLDKRGLTRQKQTELTKLERKILKTHRSNFLIRLYYAFQSKTKLFLVMEYCPGGELYFYLNICR
jgi:serine/threonine protein kinase